MKTDKYLDTLEGSIDKVLKVLRQNHVHRGVVSLIEHTFYIYEDTTKSMINGLKSRLNREIRRREAEEKKQNRLLVKIKGYTLINI